MFQTSPWFLFSHTLFWQLWFSVFYGPFKTLNSVLLMFVLEHLAVILHEKILTMWKCLNEQISRVDQGWLSYMLVVKLVLPQRALWYLVTHLNWLFPICSGQYVGNAQTILSDYFFQVVVFIKRSQNISLFVNNQKHTYQKA